MPGPTNRNNVTDFQAAVAAQGKNAPGVSPNLYAAPLNADNTTVAVTKNGQVIFSKVFWSGTAPYDKITIYAPDGTTSIGQVNQFLANLT
jgi:hypothetical protein